MKIEIKSWLTKDIIWSYECDGNTIRLTVEAAVKAGVSLNYAELNYAKLNDAKLNYAQLNGAELNYAELNNATGNTQRTHCYQHGKYKLVIVGNVCHGGCTTKTLDEWIAYDGAGLDGYELDYLNNVTKPFIRMVKALSGGG